MKYMLLHAVDEARLENLPPQIEGELDAWVEEMVARGVVLDGARLHPISDATTVRLADGQVQVTDGPFAETKEQVAGYDVIDCPDLDTAVAVACRPPDDVRRLHRGARVRRGHARPRGPRVAGRGQAPLPDAGLRRHAPRWERADGGEAEPDRRR